jgi:Na+/H+ antiporter NhaC
VPVTQEKEIFRKLLENPFFILATINISKENGGGEFMEVVATLSMIVVSIILIVLTLLIVFTIRGFLQMNKTQFVQCPNCIEKIPAEVITCKYCGKNVNSHYGAENLKKLTNKYKLQRFMDQLNDQSDNAKRFVFFMTVIIGLTIYWLSTILF